MRIIFQTSLKAFRRLVSTEKGERVKARTYERTIVPRLKRGTPIYFYGNSKRVNSIVCGENVKRAFETATGRVAKVLSATISVEIWLDRSFPRFLERCTGDWVALNLKQIQQFFFFSFSLLRFHVTIHRSTDILDNRSSIRGIAEKMHHRLDIAIHFLGIEHSKVILNS